MTDTGDEEAHEKSPVVIDISLRNQVRKERIVAVVLALLVCGIGYLICKGFR